MGANIPKLAKIIASPRLLHYMRQACGTGPQPNVLDFAGYVLVIHLRSRNRLGRMGVLPIPRVGINITAGRVRTYSLEQVVRREIGYLGFPQHALAIVPFSSGHGIGPSLLVNVVDPA